MLDIVFVIWLIGLIAFIIGFLFLSSPDEKKRASAWKMALAYLFWPVTLIAAILQSLLSRSM
jgi:branched-subunit amino acid transport protein